MPPMPPPLLPPPLPFTSPGVSSRLVLRRGKTRASALRPPRSLVLRALEGGTAGRSFSNDDGIVERESPPRESPDNLSGSCAQRAGAGRGAAGGTRDPAFFRYR